MLRPRIIATLLVHEGGLVKTTKFGSPKYVGDPINAVKIFNEKEVDELMVVDIDATRRGVEPDYKLIESIADECRMPLCYGGGISSAEAANRIISLGVEKVAISAAAVEKLDLVEQMAAEVGRQSVVVVFDVRKRLMSASYDITTHNNTRKSGHDLIDYILASTKRGAGEIVINSIDRDGVMKGYDLALAARIKAISPVPVTFLGGAGSLDDVADLIAAVGICGAAAGSLFVFKGSYRAVLINYPDPAKKEAFILDAMARYAKAA
jgi:imidazole glycerol-phosphate synthase subunit HisF